MAQQSSTQAPARRITTAPASPASPALRHSHIREFDSVDGHKIALGYTPIAGHQVIVSFDDGKYHFDLIVADGTGDVISFRLCNLLRASSASFRLDKDCVENSEYHVSSKHLRDSDAPIELATAPMYDTALQKVVKFVAGDHVDEKVNELSTLLFEIIAVAQQLAKGTPNDSLDAGMLCFEFDSYERSFALHVDDFGTYSPPQFKATPVVVDDETAELFAVPEVPSTASPAASLDTSPADA